MTKTFLKEISECTTRAALDELRTRIVRTMLPEPYLTRVLDAVREKYYKLCEIIPKLKTGTTRVQRRPKK